MARRWAWDDQEDVPEIQGLFVQGALPSHALGITMFLLHNNFTTVKHITDMGNFYGLLLYQWENGKLAKIESNHPFNQYGAAYRQSAALPACPGRILLLNPNTQTCPVFRSEKDTELTKRIYRIVPVLIREKDGSEAENENLDSSIPWGIRFMAMFHMSNDSYLFHDELVSDRLPCTKQRWCTSLITVGLLTPIPAKLKT